MPAKENVATVRNHLKGKNFYYDDEEALQRGGQAIVDAAMKIMTPTRNSPTAKANAPKLKDAIKRYSCTTERTMIYHIWKILHGEFREVKDGAVGKDQEGEAVKWIRRAWRKDYLECIMEAHFKKNCIPEVAHTGNDALDSLWSYLPRIEDPRPDVTYGSFKLDVSRELQFIFDKTHCELASTLYLPSFIVEAKTENDLAGEAENQTIRGGAAMVNCRHNWNRVVAGEVHRLDMSAKARSEEIERLKKRGKNATLPDGSTPGWPRPDHDSIAFSLGLAPQGTTMHVHWREEWADGVEFWHAHILDTYGIRQVEALERLGSHINNILDWSCGERREAIEKQAKSLGKRKFDLDEASVGFDPNKRVKN
ncbi:MAG: hypothetical protein Q9163_005045 [Psora crenata]